MQIKLNLFGTEYDYEASIYDCITARGYITTNLSRYFRDNIKDDVEEEIFKFLNKNQEIYLIPINNKTSIKVNNKQYDLPSILIRSDRFYFRYSEFTKAASDKIKKELEPQLNGFYKSYIDGLKLDTVKKFKKEFITLIDAKINEYILYKQELTSLFGN